MKSLVYTALGLLLGFGVSVGAQTFIFPDVKMSDWFGPYVDTIKDWGVVSGNDDGTFAPERNINRAEFSKMLVLYDERVDAKIEAATPEIPAPVEVPTLPPTVMYLDENNAGSLPPACPEGWQDIDTQRVWNLNSDNNRRTCMTDLACSVMYLDSRQIPADCPVDWSEAAYGSYNNKDNRRVCYQCQ